MCLAALFANLIAAVIRGATGNETVAKIGRIAILVYAAFAALTQLGIATHLTGNTLLIVLGAAGLAAGLALDRKSTRLNSSHVAISYAVFCLKKKKNINIYTFYAKYTINEKY